MALHISWNICSLKEPGKDQHTRSFPGWKMWVVKSMHIPPRRRRPFIASFLKQDYRRAVELIQDIFLHSTFTDKEREKEAEVILNEIQGYDDSPSELIFDRAEEMLIP